MISNIVEFITQYIDYPPEYTFFLYAGATVLLLTVFILLVDFFGSLFFAIFKRR